MKKCTVIPKNARLLDGEQDIINRWDRVYCSTDQDKDANQEVLDASQNKREKVVYFLLEYPDIQPDEVFTLIGIIIKQAQEDFYNLADKTSKSDREDYETAVDFLFNDDYYIDYGDMMLSFKDFCEAFDVDIKWYRSKLLDGSLKEKKLN